MQVEWFETFDGVVVAFAGTGVFALRGSEWHYHPGNSREWDAYHQAVYRNHRAERIEPAGLPPLPEVPEARMDWLDNFTRVEDRSLRGPLHEKVARAPGGRATVYVVLVEDPYETSFGDGLRRDFAGASWSEPPARALMAEREAQGYRCALRTLTLDANGPELRLEDFRLETYDRAQLEAILADLARPG
ncbi:MAG: hypothetical protein AB1758_11840 [Candidatus Eremiobacterota bacterium]